MKISITKFRNSSVSSTTHSFHSKQKFINTIVDLLIYVMGLEEQVKTSGESFLRNPHDGFDGIISDSLQTIYTKNYIEWTMAGTTTQCKIILD